MGKLLIIVSLILNLLKVNALKTYTLYFNVPIGTTIQVYSLKDYNLNEYDLYDIASTLESYIILDQLPYLIKTTDDQINLIEGKYFITFINEDYHIESLYIDVDHDIDVFPKTIKKQGKTYDLTINKQWVGKKKDKITISLYENDCMIHTIILSSQNNYTHCIKGLNDNNKYIIVEEKSDEYDYFIKQDGNHITLVNVEKHREEKLPQTGLPIIIIPILMFIGILCLMFSFI